MWTTPKTWSVGDPATAADFNIYIRDNSAWVFGDLAWTAPTFTNGWVNLGSGYDTAGFKLIGNVVMLKGAISSGTLGTSAFTLPAGYRPLAIKEFCFINTGNTGVAVTAAGTVVIGSAMSAALVSLEGITFSTI